MLVGTDNKFDISIFKTSIRLTIRMHVQTSKTRGMTDFHLDYWQFLFGSIARRRLCEDDLIESVKEILEDYGLRMDMENDYRNIDDSTLENRSSSSIKTFVMLDLSEDEYYVK